MARLKMPLVVALHGYGGNQDYFSALVKNLPELCEQYGFIFVAPTVPQIFAFFATQKKK